MDPMVVSVSNKVQQTPGYFVEVTLISKFGRFLGRGLVSVYFCKLTCSLYISNPRFLEPILWFP